MVDFYKRRHKIVGGPGCGKTTEVMKILKKYFKAGLQPSQVLMIGFARATVQTLQERAQEELHLSEKQVDSIKTIHKYCRDKIGFYEVFIRNAKREFIKKLKTDTDNWVLLDTAKDTSDEEFSMWDEKTDKKLGIIFSLIGFARHERNKTLEQILEFHSNHDDFKFSRIQRSEIKYCFNNLTLFKKYNNMIDF